ncbi:hypothetical protein [Helicobacter heilmannii]|uniref:Uncharacterized protein n=1 Tax=Helicobacter heilmannii TaxID=35817 RepID=A0A0K2XIK8_HELHE|nr:hypothetical protein [Helicobacter heilmannii]CRF46298.1 hypothetical protein HHE014_12960 [Helicobacter heilmannii]CRF47861.1 hypothetical protein HHE02_11590 [Helicobacter heilmannii]CRF48459.1 hypothetical protein HHE03_00060 [Helicobacter heilmannii]CRF50709.1 hypothetical protein HHE06_05520 [Helicobacter heilmannii]CRI34937.1 hypothetical protein HHE01_07380 [Helicobacter heilmannii]
MDLDEICDLLEQDKLLQNAVHFSLVDDFVCTYTNAAPVFKVHNAHFVQRTPATPRPILDWLDSPIKRRFRRDQIGNALLKELLGV